MTTTVVPELENALSAAFPGAPGPKLEFEAPDLMGAWRAAEDRARAVHAQEVAKALVEWANLHLHTDDDRREFLQELAKVLGEGDLDGFKSTLEAWVRTATELSDPTSREILLGEHATEDYEDVTRPS